MNPAILRWARRVAGFSVSDAARKASVGTERLEDWEEGRGQPTLRQLRLLAKAYRRPTAFFYRTAVPPEPEAVPDFRLLPEAAAALSPELRYEVRRARARRQTALDLLSLLGEEPPEIALATSRIEGIASVAQQVRSFLQVPSHEQFAWRNTYDALNRWIEAAESRGILVFQFSDVEVGEARGFSLSERPLPVLALNGSDWPRPRIFTLMHELAHIALDLGGICDLHEPGRDEDIEPFCNAVAAEALVPGDVILAERIVAEHGTRPEWDDSELERLADRYMVSREVILRKLLTHGLTTTSFYQERRDQFLEEYQLRSEEGGGGFLHYFRRVLRNNGRGYTSLVLDAYERQVISVRDLSHYLGDVNLRHVDSIRSALVGSAE